MEQCSQRPAGSGGGSLGDCKTKGTKEWWDELRCATAGGERDIFVVCSCTGWVEDRAQQYRLSRAQQYTPTAHNRPLAGTIPEAGSAAVVKTRVVPFTISCVPPNKPTMIFRSSNSENTTMQAT